MNTLEELETFLQLKGKLKAGRLESWRVAKRFLDDPLAICWGYVYDDTRWDNGAFIHTSAVVELHTVFSILETRNSYYILGLPYSEEVEQKHSTEYNDD